jgi:DNA polymerase I
MALIFDIETDGLLDNVTKVHVLVIKNSEGTVFTCNNVGAYRSVEDGLKLLMNGAANGEKLVGHNVIKYDIPVLQKLYPWFQVDASAVIDTMVCTRLIWSNLKMIDSGLVVKGKLPGKMLGSHSLEAWGHRLGEFKGDYKDAFKAQAGESYKSGDEWAEWNQEMQDYCVQDIVVTEKLFEKIVSKNYSQVALDLEHEAAWLLAQQERNGFKFDEGKAKALYIKLASKRHELENQMKELFPPWELKLPDFIPKRDNKSKGYKAGVPVPRSKTIVFNPSSRDHIADRLQALYGWKPVDFTDSGKPMVDEEVISKLDYPPCKLIAEYLMVDKRIGQLAEGNQAWLKQVKKGFIHGSVNPNGAITGRATHSYPNVAQVPSSGSPYGHECRELFTVPSGWLLVGADTSGLELRCLAHFMARYDDGAYGTVLLNGDIHTENQQAAGLPDRNAAKRFIYAYLYGGGDALIGSLIGGDSAAGKKIKSEFLKKTPALKKLKEAVEGKAKKDKTLRGLDGRTLYSKSVFSSINLLLQSAGALICKKWIVLIDKKLKEVGYRHGFDGDYAFCAWVHDEVQIACRTEEHAEIVAEVCKEAAVEAGEFFQFRIPIAGEAKVGKTWAETH